MFGIGNPSFLQPTSAAVIYYISIAETFGLQERDTKEIMSSTNGVTFSSFIKGLQKGQGRKQIICIADYDLLNFIKLYILLRKLKS